MRPRSFVLFRRWLLIGLLVSALITSTAFADGGGSLLGPFDLTDSRGIRLSQYQMSLDDGTGLTKLSLAKTQYFWVISLLWSGYTAFIGIAAWLLDWTIGLTWVGWIAGPVSAIEQTLRNSLLAPLGANRWGGPVLGMLLVIGGAFGAWRVRRGGASGWIDMLWSAVAAMLAVTLFAAPVVMVAGDGTSLAAPLRTAQQAGIALSEMITTGKAPTTQVGGTVMVERENEKLAISQEAGQSRISQMLLDAFVRPVHQQLNYGAVLDEADPKCAGRYDELLKAGPYDGSAKEIRKGMGDCNAAYLDFADAGASATWVFGFAPYSLGVLLLGLLLLTFAVLMWASVVALLWSALSAMIHVVVAILPGPARNGFLRDLVSIVANLVYLVINMVTIAVIVKIVEWGFAGVGGPIGVKFIAVDILLLAGIVLLIWTKIRHSKGERSLLKAFTRAIAGREAPPTRVDRGAQWVSGTTQAAAGRTMSGAGRKMVNAVTSKPAAAVVTAAAGAATGGAAAGAVANTMKAARVAAAVNDARQSRAPTTGSKVADAFSAATKRAHDHVTQKVDAARAIRDHERTASGPARATTGNRPADAAAQFTGSVQRRMDKVNAAWTTPLIEAERRTVGPVVALTKPPAPEAAPRRPTPTTGEKKPRKAPTEAQDPVNPPPPAEATEAHPVTACCSSAQTRHQARSGRRSTTGNAGERTQEAGGT